MGLIWSGYTSLTLMSSDRELTDYLWPVVREIIKTTIENRQNLIVEGCYIPFDWAEDFEKEYRSQIQYRCLVMSEAYIRAHYHNIKKYASTVEYRADDGDCTLENLIRDNSEVLEQCRKYGVEYTLINETDQINIEGGASSALATPVPA